MRRWVKFTIGGVVLAALGFAALAGISAYFVFRHLETRTATEPQTRQDFEAVRTRFAGRAPMIEVVDVRAGDVRIQRTRHPQGLRGQTLHVLTWNAEDDTLFRTNVPLWLMRFSSVNVLSHLGVAPSQYRLTVEDLARFGPGLIVDYQQPGKNRVVIWLE